MSRPTDSLSRFVDVARRAHGWLDRHGHRIALFLLAAWAVAMVNLCLTASYVPDEAWFLMEALASGVRARRSGSWAFEIFAHSNAFGYGGLWWGAYTALVRLTDAMFRIVGSPEAMAMADAYATPANLDVRVELYDHARSTLLFPMFLMRQLSLGALFAFFFVAIRSARSGISALLGMACVLGMPLAYWSGKIASPELLAASLFALGTATWFSSGRLLASVALVATGASLKLTLAPVSAAFFVVVGWNELARSPDALRPALRRLAQAAAASVGIFLVCNLSLLRDPSAFVATLVRLGSTYGPIPDPLEQFRHVAIANPGTWEGTSYGSLGYWAGSPWAFVGFVLVAFVARPSTASGPDDARRRDLPWFLLLASAAYLAFMMRQPYHGWYSFGLVLSASLAFFTWTSPRGRPLAAACLGLLLLAPTSLAAVRVQLRSRILHVRELAEVRPMRTCVQARIEEMHPEIVYDLGVIGVAAAPGFRQRVNYHDSFLATIRLLGEPMAPDGRRLAVIGRRAFESHPHLIELRRRSEAAGRPIHRCRGTVAFSF